MYNGCGVAVQLSPALPQKASFRQEDGACRHWNGLEKSRYQCGLLVRLSLSQMATRLYQNQLPAA